MSFGWLWGADDLEEDQEVHHESGASRMGGALCSVCCAPFVLILAMILTGWNEKNSVCEAKAISEGQRLVKSVGCDSASAENGNLIFFSCTYTHEGLSEMTPPGDFNNRITYAGTGLKVESNMFLCKENENKETKKDNVGGGKTTIITYYYTKVWSSKPIDSSLFHKPDIALRDCGDRNPNPGWDVGIPQSYTKYAPKVKVGAFTVGDGYVSSIALDSFLKTPNVPSGWTLAGNEYTTSTGAQPNIGDYKINFRSSSGNKMVSVLGKNNGGTISTWRASSSWGCSGNTLGSLVNGEVKVDDFFKDLKAANTAVTWLLRLVGFAIFWLGFSMFFAPLEVFADCIPCIGPYLGDAINCISCCLSCFPACACFLFVAGIVWVGMRPLVGIPMILICCICTALGVAYKMKTGKLGGGKYMDQVQGDLDPSDVGKVEDNLESNESRPDGMGAFFSKRAPSGRPWHSMVSGVTPDVNNAGELSGVWRDCMEAAVRYESANPDWAEDPTLADGPAGQVIAWLEANHPEAVGAANKTEESFR